MDGGSTEADNHDIVDEYVLEKTKLLILKTIESDLWDKLIAFNEPSLEFSKHVHFMSDDIVARIVCRFLTKDEGDHEFVWYASWWQELREHVFPGWWLSKYPSKTEVKKKIKSVATYPSIKFQGMTHKPFMRWQNALLELEDDD